MTLAGATIVFFFAVVALLAPWIAPYPPDAAAPGASPLEPPSLRHPFGTNDLGYDMLSRVIWGTRVVLQVVLLSSVLSILVGVPLGLISGYYGGPLDRALSMVMDSLYAFPGIIMAIAVASVLGPSVINAALALMVVYVPTYYRMTRARVLELKSEPFIEALKAMGAPDSVIIVRHILPNLAPTVLVVFGLAGADAILTEAGLSFFGLVAVYPEPDWGLDIYYGKKFLLSGAWWLVFFPGAAILLLAMGFALLGDGLSERFKVRGG
jgi:peptide/nickel transport system permease protein